MATAATLRMERRRARPGVQAVLASLPWLLSCLHLQPRCLLLGNVLESAALNAGCGCTLLGCRGTGAGAAA